MTARELIRRVPGAVTVVHWVRRIQRGRHEYWASGGSGALVDWEDWGYQRLDREIVDYKLFRLPGLPLDIRGPAPQRLGAKGYIACIGAAQTFGRYCEEPFPYLTSMHLGIPVLNLGFAGAGPRFFLRYPQLIELMDNSRLVVVQVMSARSEDNSLFDSGGLEVLTIRSTGQRMGAQPAYKRLLQLFGIRLVKSIIAETRANWVASYTELLSQVRVPTILLWFSTRQPEYEETYDSVGRLFGQFPQLVNREMVEIVRTRCDAYVHCATDRGLPHQLTSRYTGRPVSVANRPDLGGGMETEDSYYPSPEMHRDAANLLAPVCRRLLDREA